METNKHKFIINKIIIIINYLILTSGLVVAACVFLFYYPWFFAYSSEGQGMQYIFMYLISLPAFIISGTFILTFRSYFNKIIRYLPWVAIILLALPFLINEVILLGRYHNIELDREIIRIIGTVASPILLLVTVVSFFFDVKRRKTT